MTRHHIYLAWLVTSLLVGPQALEAQVLPATPDTTGARVHLGPILMNPTLSLSDVGMDTNLFNDATSERPKRDVTLTLVPQSDLWMRAGRTWLTGNVRQELLWFREYEDQRASNGLYQAGWVVPLTRFSLFVNGTWTRAKERPNFEVDTRAARAENAVQGAAEYRVRSRTLIGARLERRSIRFAEDTFFERRSLHDELSRTRTGGAVTVRHELTPLTSLTADFSGYRDRFVASPDRNASAVQGSLGVRFDPAALLRGAAQIGYRRFTPVSTATPAFTGATFSASMSLTTPSATSLVAEVVRDLEYSFEEQQPYYVLSAVAATVGQRVWGPFELFGRVGYRTLAYRQGPLADPLTVGRRDEVWTYGGGPSYRLGQNVRASLDIERQARYSPLVDRDYSGLRYGVTVTYGL